MAAPTVPGVLDLVRELEPVVAAHAEESERRRELAPPIVDALVERQLFRLLIPESLGGLEVDPVAFHRVVEAASRLDGSTGWAIWIACSSSWLARHSNDSAAAGWFADPRACFAGAVFPFGRAESVEGGYRVTGRWPYASGCLHATVLGGFCNSYDGGEIRVPRAGGPPEVRMFWVPAAEATIHDTWHVSGLAATGSHDIEVVDHFVPEEQTTVIGPGAKLGSQYQSPLYTFPFLGIFSTPCAAVALGIAQTAIDRAIEIAQTKIPAGGSQPLRDRSAFQFHVADAIAAVSSARAWLYEELESAWATAASGAPVDMTARGRLMLAAANATRSAARGTELVYLASGASANYLSNPLQRALRDIHAVTQHIATAPAVFDMSVRMLLGLPPQDFRFLA